MSKKDTENAAGTAPQVDSQAEAAKIIEAAKAEAAAIVAQAQAEAEAAKTPVNAGVNAAVNPDDELVPVYLFKDNDKYKDDVFVAVNGERVQIKRGETVMVKRKFARVLEQSQKQDTKTANLIQQESDRYKSEAERRGMM